MRTMLHGRRVKLEPVERTQLPQLQAWFSRYELQRTMNPNAIRPINLEAEEAWFEGATKDANSFVYAIHALDGASPGRVIGTCSLFSVNGRNRSAMLGIAVADPAARGHGYGTEALELLLEFGFLELNLNRIALFVHGNNPRARKLYERIGFKLEGTLRQAVFREGRYWDEFYMAILREEYQPDPIWGLDAPQAGASS